MSEKKFTFEVTKSRENVSPKYKSPDSWYISYTYGILHIPKKTISDKLVVLIWISHIATVEYYHIHKHTPYKLPATTNNNTLNTTTQAKHKKGY